MINKMYRESVAETWKSVYRDLDTFNNVTESTTSPDKSETICNVSTTESVGSASEASLSNELGDSNRENDDSSDSSIINSSIENLHECSSDGTEAPLSQTITPIKETLKVWAIENQVSHLTINSLLKALSIHFPDKLPKDARTLLHTQHNLTIDSWGGQNKCFCYFGLKEALCKILDNFETKISKDILFDLHVDGLPLFKSSSVNFWPILCGISYTRCEPSIVAVFCGEGKPDINTYLSKFCIEYTDLVRNGFFYNCEHYSVRLRAFICDAPARAFLKQCKGHNAYSGCEKCVVRGQYKDKTMSYEGSKAVLRSDESFLQRRDPDHHREGKSPLETLGIGLVSQFPLDYMHLVILGVMRKLLKMWCTIIPYKMSNKSKTDLSSSIAKKSSDESFGRDEIVGAP
jgi:hypothetical protein